MKKLFVVLAILFIGILLAGCMSQQKAPVATPTPTAVPTVIPTAVPTAEPTKEAVVVVVNKTATATVTATPTQIPMSIITFNKDLTITPGETTTTVKSGTMVVWKNDDPFKPHGVEASNLAMQQYFDKFEIPYGQTYEVVFNKTGVYDYTTSFQPFIHGRIIVQ